MNMFGKKAAAGVFAALFLLAMTPFAARATEATSAVNRLAVDLYGLFSNEGENLCFSPYSISTAFAMASAGARGETAFELRCSLRYGANIHSANRALAQKLMRKPEEAGELEIANSIWPAAGSKLQKRFENIISGDYFSEIRPQDYARQPERARAAINDWVAEKTRDRIKDILTPGSVRANTKMVLVNAVYFKAPWLHPFGEYKTQDADFYVSAAEKRGVRMMNIIDQFEYADFGDAQVLKLPYRQDEFSMLLILPRDKNGLKALESKLTLGAVERYKKGLEGKRVSVFLPRFKVEQTFDLIPALASLGVKAAFSPMTADFSGMNGKRDLFISAAVHKAFVEVDENGTEAAAATAIALRLSAAIPEDTARIPVFRADHPFIYLIQDNESGTILFMGKLEKP